MCIVLLVLALGMSVCPSCCHVVTPQTTGVLDPLILLDFMLHALMPSVALEVISHVLLVTIGLRKPYRMRRERDSLLHGGQEAPHLLGANTTRKASADVYVCMYVLLHCYWLL